jgi:hypothetical protein
LTADKISPASSLSLFLSLSLSLAISFLPLICPRVLLYLNLLLRVQRFLFNVLWGAGGGGEMHRMTSTYAGQQRKPLEYVIFMTDARFKPTSPCSSGLRTERLRLRGQCELNAFLPPRSH